MRLSFDGKGYTLVELVMVILLLAALAVFAIPNFINLGTDAKTAATKDTMAAIKRAITGDGRVQAGGVYTFPGFEADMGRLPTSLSELVTQGADASYNPLTRIGWRGPYIDTSTAAKFQYDAWGTAFVYSTSPRQIQSCGPDKTCNTSDDIILSY